MRKMIQHLQYVTYLINDIGMELETNLSYVFTKHDLFYKYLY